ncbi:MAG: hypothetical protein DMG07_24340, partial [Acidobacteria bacterium]
ALIEEEFVSGVARNLLSLGRALGEASVMRGTRAVSLRIATFDRRAARCRADAGTPFVCAARDAGLQVDVIPERFRYDLRAARLLAAHARRCAPDVIETHSVKSHFLVALTGAARGRRWLAFHHGYTATDLRMRLYNQLDRWSLRGPDRIVTVCRAFADELQSRVVADAVDEEHFGASCGIDQRRAREALGLAPDHAVILSIGRLSREKDQATLLRAFAELRRRAAATPLVLVVAGDGPERERLAALASRLGMGAACRFAGHVADVRPLYSMASALVLSSRSEGTPNVLLEAMAARVPIVATAVGGVPEMLQDGVSALLVPPESPADLAAAVQRLLADPARAADLARAARAVAAERYAPDRRRAALEQLYLDLAPGAVTERA